MLDDIDMQNIRDLDGALDCIKKLFNLVETLNQNNLELKRQNQELRDEINRLKGEQGKPKIKPSKKNPSQYSSEKDQKNERNAAKKTASKLTTAKSAM
jgi:cell division septum initiation protein DivIVA